MQWRGFMGMDESHGGEPTCVGLLLNYLHVAATFLVFFFGCYPKIHFSSMIIFYHHFY